MDNQVGLHETAPPPNLHTPLSIPHLPAPPDDELPVDPLKQRPLLAADTRPRAVEGLD